MTVKLVLVDNHRLFREGMRSLISTQSDMQVVGEASQAPEAHGIIDQARPDVLVLEISPQGGISIVQEVLRQHPQQRILVLSMSSDEEHVAQALTAGVAGYALRELSAAELFTAIRAVARGETHLAPGISRGLVNDYMRKQTDGRGPAPLRILTEREREIFDLVARGLSTRDIAAQLSISERTVETHRRRILRKLHLHSATDLARLAARLGLLAF